MKTFQDQTGRSCQMEHHPAKRIVSLVPSQTDLLAYLGLEKEVVGVTKFCVHPTHWRKAKELVGGTKQLHLDRILDLEPDLIIANEEENDREQVLALAEKIPVWVSRVVDLPSAQEMIVQVGALTGRHDVALELAQEIGQSFEQLPDFPKQSALYLIWRKPYMASGGDTFINSMMAACGLENVLQDQKRYPELSTEQIQALNPAVILLSSEPFPFKEKHIAELSALCPNAAVRLVDGEMFSWYGSRLLQSAAYFRNLRTDI